jgi:transposase-like protein
MQQTEIYTYIATRAAERGISISKLCEEVGIHRDTLEKWKRKTPKSIEILKKIDQVLNSNA